MLTIMFNVSVTGDSNTSILRSPGYYTTMVSINIQYDQIRVCIIYTQEDYRGLSVKQRKVLIWQKISIM